MSDFLLIVPAGWSEFPDINALVNDGAVPFSDAYLWVGSNDWEAFDGLLINANHPVDGKLVKGAKMFQDNTGFRIWLQLE